MKVAVEKALRKETAQFAKLKFGPVEPPFGRIPDTLAKWMERAEGEFRMFGFVELALGCDDAKLADMVKAAPDASLGALDALTNVADRWAAGAEYLRNAEFRLMAALARHAVSN